MVRDDGKEMYGIVNRWSAIVLAGQHPWLRENVFPSLPLKKSDTGWEWDENHPDYKNLISPEQMAEEVRQMVTSTTDPQLWGWYCAYDHVLLAQLFGRMIDLPEGIPMHSNDLKQTADWYQATLPPMRGAEEHNALSDAREIRWRYHWLHSTWRDTCPCDPGGSKHCELI